MKTSTKVALCLLAGLAIGTGSGVAVHYSLGDESTKTKHIWGGVSGTVIGAIIAMAALYGSGALNAGVKVPGLGQIMLAGLALCIPAGVAAGVGTAYATRDETTGAWSHGKGAGAGIGTAVGVLLLMGAGMMATDD
eukprot:tig00000492_g1488.t1